MTYLTNMVTGKMVTGLKDTSSRWYNKNGDRISEKDAHVLLRDPLYKIINHTVVLDRYEVSTVWLGMDHNFRAGSGKPLIFETMVFKLDKSGERSGDYAREILRHSTYEEAEAGHRDTVDRYREKYRILIDVNV